MQDSVPDLLRVNIEETWHRCPPRREEVVRIFSSAGWIAPQEGAAVEAAYLTLAKILDLGTRGIPMRPSARLAAREKVVSSYAALLQAITPILAQAGAPPPPPMTWVHAMDAWCKEVQEEQPREGSPRNKFLHITMPMLLALYQITFRREPAATPGGPTERFLMSIHKAMSEAWKSTAFEDADWGRSVRDHWRPPEQGALLQRIRTFRGKAESQIPVVEYFLDGFYEALSNPERKPTRH